MHILPIHFCLFITFEQNKCYHVHSCIVFFLQTGTIINFFYSTERQVVSGMDVVSAIEQVGSESGRTRVPVQISDSGQLR